MLSARSIRLVLAVVLLQGSLTSAPAAGPQTDPAGPPPAGGGQRSTIPDTGFVAEWSWPLRPVPAVLRAFDKPEQDWRPGHRGVDLRAAGPHAGATDPMSVLSPAAGVVSFAGRVVDRGVVSIDHGDGRISSFEPVDPLVRKGQQIGEGDAVATITPPPPGSAGGVHCSVPCLHWGVRVDGEYVDPLGFVSDRRPSVLLPMYG